MGFAGGFRESVRKHGLFLPGLCGFFSGGSVFFTHDQQQGFRGCGIEIGLGTNPTRDEVVLQLPRHCGCCRVGQQGSGARAGSLIGLLSVIVQGGEAGLRGDLDCTLLPQWDSFIEPPPVMRGEKQD